MDHIYAVIDKNLYRQPDTIKGDRLRRDVKKICTFHEDIEHNSERCVDLKGEIKRLIRATYLKEFMDEPPAVNKEERSRQWSLERIREVLTIIGEPHVAGESCSARNKYAKEARNLP